MLRLSATHPMTATQTWRRWTLAAGLLTLSAPAWGADPEVHVLPVADRAPGERRPLLIFLHGLGGSGAEALANPELRALAERGRMYLVAPDGFVDRQGATSGTPAPPAATSTARRSTTSPAWRR